MAELACPFCGDVVPADLLPVPPAPQRMSRRMIALFATSLAVGCASSQPLYGVPVPDDTGLDVKADGALDTWDTSPAPAYGMPADTGTTLDTGVSDEGGPAPAYGMPADTGG